MSTITIIGCEQCGKRADEMEVGWSMIEDREVGKGVKISVKSSDGQYKDKDFWRAIHFCSIKCFKDFIDQLAQGEK